MCLVSIGLVMYVIMTSCFKENIKKNLSLLQKSVYFKLGLGISIRIYNKKNGERKSDA